MTQKKLRKSPSGCGRRLRFNGCLLVITKKWPKISLEGRNLHITVNRNRKLDSLLEWNRDVPGMHCGEESSALDYHT